MKRTELSQMPVKPNPHNVTVRLAFDHEHAQIMHITLEPGQAMKWHVTPVDVVFYVLEGKVNIGIGEEEEEVVAGTIVESPKGIKHMLANPFKERTSFLVMKLPRPVDKSKLL